MGRKAKGARKSVRLASCPLTPPGERVRRARSYFLFAVQVMQPQVWADLRRLVLPVADGSWPGLFLPEQGRLLTTLDLIDHYLDRHNRGLPLNGAEPRLPPEPGDEARFRALFLWADFWSILTKWVVVQAWTFLSHCAANPELSDRQALSQILQLDPTAPTLHLERPGRITLEWYPLNETRSSATKRIRLEVRAWLDDTERRYRLLVTEGTSPRVPPVKELSHFGWLAAYQCSRLEFDFIAGLTGLDPTTIREGVESTARLIGLPRRPNRSPGRPRKLQEMHRA